MKSPVYLEITNGNTVYYSDREMTKLHRTDGPAIEYSDGTKEWWLDGKLHRTDGPAIEYSGGIKSWYVNGKRMTEKEFVAATAPTIELTLDEIAAKFGVPAGNLKIKK